MKSTWRTSLPVVIALLAFPAMRASGEPQVPLLEMNVDPVALWVPQPCPLTDTVTLQFRNNSLAGPITVTWTSNYIAHPATCVADYDPKDNPIGVPIVIPAQGVHNETITLSFIENCDGTTTINFQGTVVGSDPPDTDAVTLTVYCNEPQPPVPTVSEWGLIVLTLLAMTLATIMLARRHLRRVGRAA